MKNLIEKLIKDESGQDMAEYAIALGLIAVAAVTVFGTLSTAVNAKISAAATALG